jgi:hypothetical protein
MCHVPKGASRILHYRIAVVIDTRGERKAGEFLRKHFQLVNAGLDEPNFVKLLFIQKNCDEPVETAPRI